MTNSNTTNLDSEKNTIIQVSSPRFDLTYLPQSSTLDNALNAMFPVQTYEDGTVQRAKEILGKSYTPEDVKSLIASFEYLINVWLVEYEKKIFGSKTLQELLADL